MKNAIYSLTICALFLLFVAACDDSGEAAAKKQAASNAAPVATDDAIQTDEDTSVDFDPLANDGDPDGDALTLATFTQPANGSVSLVGTLLRYQPAANFHGADSFGYVVEDTGGLQAYATVSVTVLSVNDAPLAVADATSTIEYVAVDIDVLANDTDVEGDALTVTSVTQPTNGAASVLASGLVRYMPASGFSGNDSFDYTCQDPAGLSDTATVSITVTPLVWTSSGLSNHAAGFGTWGVVSNDFDQDGREDLLTYNSDFYNYGGAGSTISVFLNNGSPTAGAPSFTRTDYTTTAGARMVCADINTDGLPDVITGSLTGFEVLLNDPASPGAFLAGVAFSAGLGVWDIAAGDIDGDGRPDVAVTVTGATPAYAYVFVNLTSQGATTPAFGSLGGHAVGSPTMGYAMGIAIGDLNGDGLAEVVVSNELDNATPPYFGTVQVLVASNAGGGLSFTTQSRMPVGLCPRNLEIADIDGDGRNDVAVCCYGGNDGTLNPAGTLWWQGGELVVLQNVTQSGVSAVSLQIAGSWSTGLGGTNAASFPHGTYALSVGELDADGRPDIAVANSWPNDCVSVLLNRSTPGNFAFAVADYITDTEGYGVVIGDWNMDGTPDIAHTADTQNLGHGTVNILLGQR